MATTKLSQSGKNAVTASQLNSETSSWHMLAPLIPSTNILMRMPILMQPCPGGKVELAPMLTSYLYAVYFAISESSSFLLTSVLQHVAIKLYSIRVNSMADERTGSTFTWMTPAVRNRMSVEAMAARADIKQHYTLPV